MINGISYAVEDCDSRDNFIPILAINPIIIEDISGFRMF